MKFPASPSFAPLQLPLKTETHLWYILPNEVKSPRLLEDYSRLLSPKEKDDVLRVNGDQLKKRAVLTRALVRTTLARYHPDDHVTPISLTFKKNLYGKPEVDWPHMPLQFNISHTDSMIVCAVTLNDQVGVDVEHKRRVLQNDIMSFAKRYFSTTEVVYLSAIPDTADCLQELIKLWTLKEAYVKALGRGFSAAPFNSFTVPFGKGRGGNSTLESNVCDVLINSRGNHNSLERNWKFILLELVGSHFCAICRHSHGEETFSLNLKVWRTIPFVEDECIFTKLLRI